MCVLHVCILRTLYGDPTFYITLANIGSGTEYVNLLTVESDTLVYQYEVLGVSSKHKKG